MSSKKKYSGPLTQRNQEVLSRSQLMKDQAKYHQNTIQKRKIDFYKGYIYIHLHQEDIGKINNKTKSLTDADLAREFLKYKNLQDGKSTIVGRAVKRQYKELMMSSMDMDSDQYDFLDEVLNPKNKRGDKILDELNRGLKEGFEKQFTDNKIESLLRKEKKDNWSSKGKDVEDLNNLLKNGAKEGFEVLDNVLDHMVATVALLQSPQGEILMKVISNARKDDSIQQDYKKLGECLTKALNAFINETDKTTIEGRDAIQVAQNFKVVTEGLQRGTNKKGNILTAGALQGLIQNNFYSLTAEVFASHLDKAAEDAAVQYVAETVEDIDLIGDSPVALEFTSPSGSYGRSESERTFFQNKSGSIDENYGKADLRFNNVQVDMSLLGNGELGKLVMKIGLSNKAYVTNTIGGSSLKDFKNQHFSLGGGMTLGNAFTLLLGQGKNLWKRYLGYNILARGDSPVTIQTQSGSFVNPGLPLALETLQDVLLTRSILYLVAGRSKEDFAQFMFLNGQLLSVWDIVKYAINNNIGKSSSRQISGQESGIYMSIPNREIFQYYASVPLLGIRVPDTNNVIDRAVMKGHLIPGAIANYIDPSKVKKS